MEGLLLTDVPRGFRDFYAARNNLPLGVWANPGELNGTVNTRVAETMADWCDMLASRVRTLMRVQDAGDSAL